MNKNNYGPRVEEVLMLSPPDDDRNGEDSLFDFGVLLYDVRLPGVRCSDPSCPAEAYGGSKRVFTRIPQNIARTGAAFVRAGRRNIPIEEYEVAFGRRQPELLDPAGFPYPPGSDGGDAHLYLASEPIYDVIWPKWGVGMLVSDRVKSLFESAGITGLKYHCVASAKVIGENPFRQLCSKWRWRYERFARAVSELEGTEAGIRFYEIEAEKSASVGLHFKLACPRCGYVVHDTQEARCEGLIKDWPGTDWFSIHGLGRPVCVPRVVEALREAGMVDFTVEPVSEIIRSIIEDEEP